MPGDPRVSVTFRMAEKGRDKVDDLLTHPGMDGADRSTVLRAALVVAFRHKAELIETIKEQM